jgi:long-chain acyl-CoA synthetase
MSLEHSTKAVLRVFDLLEFAQQTHPTPNFCNYKRGDTWISFSTSDIIKLSDKLAAGLLSAGIKTGDLVAIIAYNCPEWNIVDFACQKIGVVTVPCYHNLGKEDYKFILEQTEVKAIFTGDLQIHQTITSLVKDLAEVPQVYCFAKSGQVNYWETLFDLANDSLLAEVKNLKQKISPQQLCSILYTSGTTGKPNGVMLSHENMTSNFLAGANHIPVTPGERTLSFLPISHAFERTVLYILMLGGVQIWYADSPDSLSNYLKEVRPHIFTTVPRVLEKVYDRILQRGYQLKRLRKGIFFWALNLALQYEPGKNKGALYNIQLQLARKLVFVKWQEALGGNLKVIVCGGAALQNRLGQVFWGAGIKIMEGYGMTEASPVIAVNHLQEEDNRVGTLGLPLENLMVKLSSEGELIVRGPSVFLGYYKNPELTKLVKTEDGWLSTGDIVEWVEDRFLKMTDRKKDLFKTSGGMYIPPSQIELLLKEIMVFEQVVVIGEGQKFPAALITVNWASLKDWAGIHGLIWTNDTEMLLNPEVQQKFEREVASKNEKLTPYKQIKKFVVLPHNWSLETGELTVTLKVKRRIILERYAQHIEKLYQEA